VLGVMLDGHGWGSDNQYWGGEFVLGNYRHCQRMATLKPVRLPGMDGPPVAPLHALYAHLTAAIGWDEFSKTFGALDLCRRLAAPRAVLASKRGRKGVEPATTTSCGMLFDAVAAALGLCDETPSYEDEAAMRLEALADEACRGWGVPEHAYPVPRAASQGSAPLVIDPAPMWRALLADLAQDTPRAVIAARFHIWLSATIAATVRELARTPHDDKPRFAVVALSGGCFQNRILLEETQYLLAQDSFAVLTHALMPPHDGGLALGQASIGAARLIDAKRPR
jgi:hydrogenase maturation protein HypF